MPIDTEQWRAHTGLFYASRVLLRPPKCKQPQPKVGADTQSLNIRFSLAALLVIMRTGIFHASQALQLLWLSTCDTSWLLSSVVRLSCRRLRGVSVLLALCLVVVQMLLIMSEDVEENPGPPKIRTTSLGRNDLSCVWEEVLDAQSKWFDIGVMLKLSIGILEGVKEQYPNPCTALREMLLHWLKTVDPPPTWEGLACSLESRTVGEPQLAKQLRTKYCKTEETVAALPPTTTTTSSSDRDRETFSSAATGTHAAYPGPQGARKVSMSSSETVSLFPESTPGSVCGSGNEVLVPHGQNVTSSNFPHLDLRKLSEQDKLALQCKLLRDSDNIMDEFNDLTHYTIKSIVSSCVSVKEIHTRLSGLGAYKPIHKKDPLLRDKLDEIERAENVENVFNILHNYYSLFNYHIIEKLIDWFGTPEDKKRLQTYTEHFETFCKRMTFECPPDIFGRVMKGKTDIVVKVEESWGPAKGCPLETVLRLRNCLGDILGVEPSTLYLCRIDEGCVELLFQVPSFVGEDIFPLSIEQERSLTSVGVIRLTCGSYIFPQHHEECLHKVPMICDFISFQAPVPQTSTQAETQKKQKLHMAAEEGSTPKELMTSSTTVNIVTCVQDQSERHQQPPDHSSGWVSGGSCDNQRLNRKSSPRTDIKYAAGPPGDIEVVELTQKLMSLREDWTMLGTYLQLPDHEVAAADVDERTLFRKISRVLRRWIDYDIGNDRQKLASVLTLARDELGRFAEEVLQRGN